MKHSHKNILLGVGNPFRNDDGIGPFIANHFSHPQWITIDSGLAPENYSSMIKKNRPNLLLIIDSAQMNLNPGQFRIISYAKIKTLQLSTHALPLNLLMNYLKPFCQKMILIGIQPENIKIGETISDAVLKGSKLLLQKLSENQINTVPEL